MAWIFRAGSGILVLLVLAACGEMTPEEVSAFNAKLPPGCTVTELGRYGNVEDVVVVQCMRRDTTSTNTDHTRWVGKYLQHYTEASVAIK